MALGNIEGYFPPILCRPCSGWPRSSLSFSLLFSPSLPRACTRSHAEYARLDRRAPATLSPFHPRWPAKGLEPARRGCFTAVGGTTKLEEKLPRVGEGQGAEAPSPASDAVPSRRSTERYRLRKSRIDAAIGETTPKHNTTSRHLRHLPFLPLSSSSCIARTIDDLRANHSSAIDLACEIYRRRSDARGLHREQRIAPNPDRIADLEDVEGSRISPAERTRTTQPHAGDIVLSQQYAFKELLV